MWGFHKWKYPHSWMGGESIYKWMMNRGTRGTPVYGNPYLMVLYLNQTEKALRWLKIANPEHLTNSSPNIAQRCPKILSFRSIEKAPLTLGD